jgi:hypothetical protein
MADYFNEERNELARIGAMASMLPGRGKWSPSESQVARIKDNMSVQERKVFTAMSDIAKHRTVDKTFAQKVYATMSTQTYRVAVEPSGRVNITTWGLAEDIDRSYDSVDELPEWMQRKIAVLMIFDPEKPMDEIKGIGRRISRGTFWVYPDEGEDDGDDTRTPCENTGT